MKTRNFRAVPACVPPPMAPTSFARTQDPHPAVRRDAERPAGRRRALAGGY